MLPIAWASKAKVRGAGSSIGAYWRRFFLNFFYVLLICQMKKNFIKYLNLPTNPEVSAPWKSSSSDLSCPQKGQAMTGIVMNANMSVQTCTNWLLVCDIGEFASRKFELKQLKLFFCESYDKWLLFKLNEQTLSATKGTFLTFVRSVVICQMVNIKVLNARNAFILKLFLIMSLMQGYACEHWTAESSKSDLCFTQQFFLVCFSFLVCFLPSIRTLLLWCAVFARSMYVQYYRINVARMQAVWWAVSMPQWSGWQALWCMSVRLLRLQQHWLHA